VCYRFFSDVVVKTHEADEGRKEKLLAGKSKR
jgi:hypothetical protein